MLSLKALLLIGLAVLCVCSKYAGACGPGNAGIRQLLGGSVRVGPKIKLGRGARIASVQELQCLDFSSRCRWRNQVFGDQLDFHRATGTPDPLRLLQTSGTAQPPVAPFAMAFVGRRLQPSAGAALVSDVIPCQTTSGELRFKYWTSPGVTMSVCVKRLTTPGVDTFDFCSGRLTAGDPGPAFIALPGPILEPFEIFIRADNFAFSNSGISGGFAIIDDIEYFARLCSFAAGARTQPKQSGLFNNRIDEQFTEDPFSSSPSFESGLFPPAIGGGGGSLQLPSNDVKQQPPRRLDSACTLITCDFTTGACLDYIGRSGWQVARNPVGNPITGIRGDASRLPFNPAGSFGFVRGPATVVRFETPPFELSSPHILQFAYYKASADTGFQVLVKERDSPERSLFRAPIINRDSRMWFRELRQLEPANYEKLIFEAFNLGENAYVGVDEISLSDQNGQPLC